jgi:hypothetical protein
VIFRIPRLFFWIDIGDRIPRTTRHSCLFLFIAHVGTIAARAASRNVVLSIGSFFVSDLIHWVELTGTAIEPIGGIENPSINPGNIAVSMNDSWRNYHGSGTVFS